MSDRPAPPQAHTMQPSGIDSQSGVEAATKDGQEARIQEHPLQPVLLDGDGAWRFKANRLVKHLFDECAERARLAGEPEPFDLPGFGIEDREQLAQLIGHTVDGLDGLEARAHVIAAAREAVVAAAQGNDAHAAAERAERAAIVVERLRKTLGSIEGLCDEAKAACVELRELASKPPGSGR